MSVDINQKTFFELLRAGLWEKDVLLSLYGSIDFKEIYRLAQEQSVVGLIAAGLEHVKDVKITKESALFIAGETLQIEKRNTAMNNFIGHLVGKLRSADVYTLLVKGQGIAQCYERPLWRSSGDIDFLLDKDNYSKAKANLSTLAQSMDEEDSSRLHLAMTIEDWAVELHGTLKTGLGRRIDNVMSSLQNCTFDNNEVRIWQDGETDVLLPAPNNDVLFVFTHILQHFFVGGIGLRQICDWCRLMWTYSDEIDNEQLEYRLRKMGLMTEWKAFAALAVESLGMSANALPLYDKELRWKRKANQILSIILKTGNFGHNTDNSYQRERSFFVRKNISFWRNINESIRHFYIFPKDSTRILFLKTAKGFCRTAKGN